MSNPWFRMDQLLKCGICFDKYRNPKLLPCNHTFCSEPCLEKLGDRSTKSQHLKCPDCSAEHWIPHGGVQSFPNNVTLVRFLELRQQVNGHEPELPPSMQRCNTCKEKGQLEMCAHCSRKVCKDCQKAHVNILRKEIALINEEVRQGLKQLSGILHKTGENVDKIQKNSSRVKDEIEEVVRRYTRDLFDTEEKLKHELDIYLQTELRSMQHLEHDLQVEMSNVNSNCDLVDKYVNNGVDWTDAELTDYKDIFLRTLDFLRTFDSDPATDCIRKVKFHVRADPDVVHKTLIDFAEVKLGDNLNDSSLNISNDNAVQSSGPTLTLTPPQSVSNALARSQSDNRLAHQRQYSQKDRQSRNEDVDSVGYSRRRFVRDKDSSERDIIKEEKESHLGISSWRRELEEARSTTSSQKSRFSSRELLDDVESCDKEPSPSRKTPRYEERPGGPLQRIKDHVTETEDATKGPLSGVIKIVDSPHVMERLHHSEVRQKKQKEEDERKARQPPPPPPPRLSRPMNRQLSEDEIEKQKKENKAAAAAAAVATAIPSNATTNNSISKIGNPLSDVHSRTRSPQDDETRSFSSRYSSYRSSAVDDQNKKVDDHLTKRTRPTDEDSIIPTPRLRSWRTSTAEKDRIQSPPGSPTRPNRETQRPPTSPRVRETLPPSRPSSRGYLTKTSSLDQDEKSSGSPPPLAQRRSAFANSKGSLSLEHKEPEKPRLRLGILPRPQPEESSNNSSSESESATDSDKANRRGDISPSVNTLLARSAQARKQSASTQARLLGRRDDEKKSSPSSRSWRDTIRKDEEPITRRRPSALPDHEERVSPYSRLSSERRRASLTSSRFDDVPEDRFRNESSYTSRQNKIARSKSSHDLLPADDSPGDDDSLSYLRNKYRTRRTKEKSPDEVPTTWSQYLKNKYGSGRTSSSATTRTNNAISRSRTSSGLALLNSGSDNSSDEDSPSSRRRSDYRSKRGDSSSPRGFSVPRRTYMSKGRPALKIGSRGTEPGHFTWPRGVCVGSDNAIVVADSSNHRIQVFHPTGRFIQEFGSYGSNEGEFDCLAAVTVNRIGQFIVSDRYNHRIQVFDPSGRFVRTFGSEGRGDGKFSYPWGIATDNLGFIYVCDKENHRVQFYASRLLIGSSEMNVSNSERRRGGKRRLCFTIIAGVFQGDGTYVTKFGGIGQRPGELEHPHYVAVSSTNRVIVSDSNNHRVQIFDVNGRLLTTFGTEGSDEGQFKYPRGVAVDDQGYLIVGDSGNNRIQVFHPDGTFLKAFGTWGASDGEFKGLEGVSVSATGQILVCDRENHRIQVF